MALPGNFYWKVSFIHFIMLTQESDWLMCNFEPPFATYLLKPIHKSIKVKLRIHGLISANYEW